MKGDTSGHVQHVREVRLDCDGDALLLTVDQVGAACHTGDRTCFDAGARRARGGRVVTVDQAGPYDLTRRSAGPRHRTWRRSARSPATAG